MLEAFVSHRMRVMMESSDDEIDFCVPSTRRGHRPINTGSNLFHKIRNNISRKRKGARYAPYKPFMTAVRQGRIDRVAEIINSRGPCYEEEWNDGYFLLCTALEEKRAVVAKLLLTSGCQVNDRFKIPCDTPLHFAALNADTEIVRMLLNRGANINAENLNGKTALHYAVEGTSMEIIDMLLSNEANIDAADKSGVTPLHLAIINNSKEITNLLLSRGANVEGKASGPSAADKGNACTPLHFAVEEGNEEITELLLNSGANVDANGNNGVTSLHVAAEKGYLKIAQHLLIHGADINSASENGQTPLYFAVGNGHSKIVKLLLECGAYVDAKDSNDKTILHFAVEHGYAIIVKRILKHRPDPNDECNSRVLNAAVQGCGTRYREIVKSLLEYSFTVDPEDCYNFMHPAVEKGYVELVEELLEHGADVTTFPDSTVGKDSTPLHVATKNRRKEVAELLISHGADVNAQDEAGKPAIFYATQNADLKIIKLLLANKANVKDHPELLRVAVNRGRGGVVEALLQHGADINATDIFEKMRIEEQRGLGVPFSNHDAKGRVLFRRGAKANTGGKHSLTVLQAAIDRGFEKVVKALLKYNADVSVMYNGQMTTLHLSAKRGNEVITKMLLNKGVNINAEDYDGKTALHFAARNGHVEVVELLLKRGANVNATMRHNFATPLHLAAESTELGTDKIVKSLLKFGAKVNSTVDRHEFTPLHLAAITGIVEVVEVLLEFGASVNATDGYGTTALHFASKKGQEDVITALLEHGADVTMKSKGCYTALRFVTDGLDLIHDSNCGFDYDFNFDFDCVYDPETSTYINIIETLKSHMVKVRAANLAAANDDLLSISSGDDEPNDSEDDYPDNMYFDSIVAYRRDRKEYRLTRRSLQRKCENEIASMKNEKFVNTYVTFYDILVKDLSQLAIYARNESIVEAFRSGDYKKKFPIYANMISINFRKGEKRKEFLEQGNKILDVLFNDFPELPRGCTERVLGYLNDDDLRTLTAAGKPYVKEKCSSSRRKS